MGIYFYPKGQEPKYVLRTFGIFDFTIAIPPGEEYHPEVASVPFPKDAILYGITPHAHKRGGSANVSIRYPDGREEMLIALPRYDFLWQYEYFLAKPTKIPAGSTIIARWTYDNSKRNPDNPDYKKLVNWGSDTRDIATSLPLGGRDSRAPDTRYEKLLQVQPDLGVMDDPRRQAAAGRASRAMGEAPDTDDRRHQQGQRHRPGTGRSHGLLPRVRRGGGRRRRDHDLQRRRRLGGRRG